MRRFAISLAVTIAFIGVVVVLASDGPQIPPPGNGISAEERLGLQGEHHRVGRDLGHVDGRDLVVDDVVVGVDRIAIRYHATGIQPVEFAHINDNPVFAKEGATLITARADGQQLIPFEGSTSGERGSSDITGEMVFRWKGGPVHHLEISISRIMGDEHAAWSTAFDF